MVNSLLKKAFHKNILSLILLYLFVFSPGCKRYHRNNTHAEITDADIRRGESLSISYCQGCHSLPDPSLLDSKHWEETELPYMGPRLGIFNHNFKVYPSSIHDRNLVKNFYPSKPLLSPEDWQYLMDYYIATSPDSLPGQQRKIDIKVGLPLFQIHTPQISYYGPATCLIQIDTTGNKHSILLGDATRKEIFRFNSSLQTEDSILVTGPVVGLDFQHRYMVACDIGVLNPNNGKFGRGLEISLGADNKMKVDTIPLFDSLARPVQLTAVDLNIDDTLIFLLANSAFLPVHCPGLKIREVRVFNDTLFVRCRERSKLTCRITTMMDYQICGYYLRKEMKAFSFSQIRGNGKFTERKVLGFPPIYGSSYFELDDFNHDGFPDILYTCGDNADYSEVLKPYHGVYIFLNDGNNNFTQKYFFPINGCFKAMARDFDGDGDLDIATISYFPDFANQPEEGFVYLENKGNFEFQPLTVPEGKSGRWLTMDVGDLDGDGKIDIILGNFSIGPTFIKSSVQWKQGPPFLFLKNVGK